MIVCCRYADSERQVFKAPARLESMMQDYPLGLPAEEEIGFCKSFIILM